ncbi:hypothetical protein TNCV_3105421 [Trichonephila clavipes]|nr:hypothetical protein TNCV_3105421 [Trichonephila clavipes]
MVAGPGPHCFEQQSNDEDGSPLSSHPHHASIQTLILESKARSLRAQAQLIKTETKTLTIEKRAEKDGGARGSRRHIIETYLLE